MERSIDDTCEGMCRGAVKWFNEEKGFGFVRRIDSCTGKLDSDKSDIFVHYSHIDCAGYKTLCDGEIIRFSWIDTPKGLQAEKVIRTEEQYEGMDLYF